jgi:AcrR family transcriptional regulator
MQEAGLTHGGFYAHFPSRDALLVAAIEQAGRSAATATAVGSDHDPKAFCDFVASYLSAKLLKAHDAGCPVAALCSEMPRQSDEVRKASAGRVRALVRRVARLLPTHVPAEEAGVVAATLVGSLQMARALDGAAGRALLATTRAMLVARYAPD